MISGDGMGHAVFERVLAVERFDVAGEPDPVALGQGDGFRPVERELAACSSGTAAGSVTVSRWPLVKPLGVLVELDDIARPVGGGLPAFGLAGIHLHQPGKLAVLAPDALRRPQLLADRRRDGLGLRRASG